MKFQKRNLTKTSWALKLRPTDTWAYVWTDMSENFWQKSPMIRIYVISHWALGCNWEGPTQVLGPYFPRSPHLIRVASHGQAWFTHEWKGNWIRHVELQIKTDQRIFYSSNSIYSEFLKQGPGKRVKINEWHNVSLKTTVHLPRILLANIIFKLKTFLCVYFQTGKTKQIFGAAINQIKWHRKKKNKKEKEEWSFIGHKDDVWKYSSVYFLILEGTQLRSSYFKQCKICRIIFNPTWCFVSTHDTKVKNLIWSLVRRIFCKELLKEEIHHWSARASCCPTVKVQSETCLLRLSYPSTKNFLPLWMQ